MEIKLRKSKEIRVRQKAPQRKRTKAKKTKRKEGQREEKAGKWQKVWKVPEGMSKNGNAMLNGSAVLGDPRDG